MPPSRALPRRVARARSPADALGEGDGPLRGPQPRGHGFASRDARRRAAAALASLLVHAGVLLALVRAMEQPGSPAAPSAVIVRIEADPAAGSAEAFAHGHGGNPSDAGHVAVHAARNAPPRTGAHPEADRTRRVATAGHAEMPRPRPRGTGMTAPPPQALPPGEAESPRPTALDAAATTSAALPRAPSAAPGPRPQAGSLEAQAAPSAGSRTTASAPGTPARLASTSPAPGVSALPSAPATLAAQLVCHQQVIPEMPALAIEQGVGATVLARARVAHGRVIAVTIVSGPSMFHEAVRRAMLRYRCDDLGDRVVTVTQEFEFRRP